MMKKISKYHKKIIIGGMALSCVYLLFPTSFDKQYFGFDTNYIAAAILIMCGGIFFKFYLDKKAIKNNNVVPGMATPTTQRRPKPKKNPLLRDVDELKVVFPKESPKSVNSSSQVDQSVVGATPEGKKKLFEGMV